MADQIQPALSVEDAWQLRQRRRQEAREAALKNDRQRAGYRPGRAAQAALAQRQNRLEHSR